MQPIALLLLWIAANTPFTDPKPPDKFRQIPLQELQQRVQRAGHRMSRGVFALHECEPNLFGWTKGTIYMPNDMDWNGLFARSVLLHELIHHQQCRMGHRGTNSCEREQQALAAAAPSICARTATSTRRSRSKPRSMAPNTRRGWRAASKRAPI